MPLSVHTRGPGYDIVTVVYGEEIELLRLQARSFDRFLDAEFSGQILVVVNDLRVRAVTRRIEAEILPAYGRWRHRVRLIPFYDLAYRLDPSNGWIVQQVLKLACAAETQRQWYVAFDAKNHLIAPLSRHMLFDPTGRARQTIQWGSSSLPQHWDACASYYGLESLDPQLPHFVPLTPFILHVPSVLAMIRDIEARESRRLSDFFCDRRCLSEFLLYGAYLERRGGGIARFYVNAKTRVVTLWEPGASLEAALAAARDGSIICFGVHRRYLAGLGANRTSLLQAFWYEHGLIEPAEGRASQS